MFEPFRVSYGPGLVGDRTSGDAGSPRPSRAVWNVWFQNHPRPTVWFQSLGVIIILQIILRIASVLEILLGIITILKIILGIISVPSDSFVQFPTVS